MPKINISLIEDEIIVRQSLAGLIDSHAEYGLSAISESVEQFLEQVIDPEPDIILLDIGLKGGMTGLEGLKPIKEKYPEVDIIMLTTFDDSDRIFKALCGGASAYLTKQTPFSKIAEAIHTVYNGGSYMSPGVARKVVNYFAPSKSTTQLTPRQMQITQSMVDGLSYKMIADKLMISTETVRDHIKKIYKKLEIHSRTELINKSIKGEIV